MQIHFQYSATVSKSTSPCIPQTDAYDQLHLEMMHLGEKKRTKVCLLGGPQKQQLELKSSR